MTHTPADAALWRAMLAEMPIEVIVAFLREQGREVSYEEDACDDAVYVRPPPVRSYTVEMNVLSVTRRDALPPGYPPLADEDVTEETIPFNALEDTRS